MQEEIGTTELAHDGYWGSLLRQIPDPPSRLFVQGTQSSLSLLELLPDRGLAVVGCRSPQARSELQVKIRFKELIGSDLVIISGLARGIDACAHETAIALKFPTIAVLGCGFGVCYPRENERLRDEILDSGGLLITEYEHDQAAKPLHFIRRNRIIAGLARATWIVEAGFRSGSLNTASWARKAERYSYATPCYPGDPLLAGNEGLLRDGKTRSVFTAEDFSDAWLELHSSARKSQQQRPALRLVAERPDELLRQELVIRTAQSGGATIQSLFDWSAAQGWAPLDFYETLQRALSTGLISERAGILSAST
jgi:DNA protecting protein DprA